MALSSRPCTDASKKAGLTLSTETPMGLSLKEDLQNTFEQGI